MVPHRLVIEGANDHIGVIAAGQAAECFLINFSDRKYGTRHRVLFTFTGRPWKVFVWQTATQVTARFDYGASKPATSVRSNVQVHLSTDLEDRYK
jgi:hypothetical protein